METWVWLAIAAGAVLAVSLVAWLVWRARRTAGLRDAFGPEYDRTVEDTGDRRRAESDLAERQRRREELDIRPLASAARERYAGAWRTIQERFVDAPVDAVREARVLLHEVMRERGYPTRDFERRAGDLSVDHPDLVQNYRVAHDITERSASGRAATEELRRALLAYRALFDELLEASDADRADARR